MTTNSYHDEIRFEVEQVAIALDALRTAQDALHAASEKVENAVGELVHDETDTDYSILIDSLQELATYSQLDYIEHLSRKIMKVASRACLEEEVGA